MNYTFTRPSRSRSPALPRSRLRGGGGGANYTFTRPSRSRSPALPRSRLWAAEC